MNRVAEIKEELWRKIDSLSMDFECAVQHLQEEANELILQSAGVTLTSLGNCGICRKEIEEVAKDHIGLIVLDGMNRLWCKKCKDDHDNIDWDEVHENG